MTPDESQFRKFVDALPQIVYITDAVGNVRFVNQRWVEVTGCARDQLAASAFVDAVHPDDRAAAQQKWLQAYHSHTAFESELRLRTHSGDYRWFLSRSVPVVSQAGELEWYGTSTDITDAKRTQSQLARLFDANLIGIASWNIVTGVKEANDKFFQMLGYSREEFHAAPLDWRQLTPAQWHSADETALSELHRCGAHSPYEKEFLHQDGSRIPMVVGSAFLEGSDQDGITFFLDVSEQKRAQEKLARARDELETTVVERTRQLSEAYEFVDSILENIPHMIFVKDAEELRFVRFNRAGESLLGLSAQELLGKNDFDFFPPEQAQHFQRLDRLVLAGPGVVDIEEEEILTNTGLKTLRTKKIPLMDSQGRPRYLVGISEDITERKQLEAERLGLLQAEISRQEAEKTAARLRFLADASSLLGSSLDFETTLSHLTQLCVPAIADWCSLQLVQANGSLKQLAVAHQDPDKVKWAWQLHQQYPSRPDAPNGPPHVLKTGLPELVAEIPPELLRHAAVDAGHLEILEALGLRSYICAPIRVRGNVTGTLTLVTSGESQRNYTEADLSLAEDLCARAGIAVDNARLYQEAQLSNRLKDDFLATLSHELRTPINVIQGYAEILHLQLDSMDTDDVKQGLDAIRRNAHMQTRLVSDLLDISSIVTGKVHYDMQPLAPAAVVRAVVQSLRAAAEAKGIELLDNMEAAPAQIVADTARLQQVVSNLVSNAIKFTPQGGRVTCSLTQEECTCLLTVADTGIGVHPDFLPHVFDRFRQADSSVTRRFGGLGLGLSIVKSIVEGHGGSVSAFSDGLGQGSVFQVRLAMDGELRVPSVPDDDAVPVRLDGVRLLLVEDSPDTLRLLQKVLTEAGALVVPVQSAADARRFLAHSTPDLIVSDIGLPEESGIDFMRWVRTEAQLSVPSIAVTAHARHQEVKQALEVGYQEHLAKPVSPGKLLETVARVLHR